VVGLLTPVERTTGVDRRPHPITAKPPTKTIDACRGELNFSAGQSVSTLKLSEVEMSLLLVVCLLLGAPLAGLGVHDLQASLERWDQKRHAAD
jgi:hypothetical protein